MMQLRIHGIDSAQVKKILSGGPDANGQSAVQKIAEDGANPCRHCLSLIKEGDPLLVLSYRPFDTLQPYAETGPIFLHENDCEQYQADKLPNWFDYLQPAVIRGYDKNHWIRYDTGEVVDGYKLDETCRKILNDEDIAYVHIRSKFNCFQCQVERAN